MAMRPAVAHRAHALGSPISRTVTPSSVAAPSKAASAKDWPRREIAGAGVSTSSTAKPARARASPTAEATSLAPRTRAKAGVSFIARSWKDHWAASLSLSSMFYPPRGSGASHKLAKDMRYVNLYITNWKRVAPLPWISRMHTLE